MTKKLDKLATREQVDGLGAKIDANTKAIKNNNDKIYDQQLEMEGIRGSLRTLEMELNDNRRSFDMRVKRLINSSSATNDVGRPAAASSTAQDSGPTSLRSDRERTLYEAARRSLRIWPIPGETQDELVSGVTDFCHGALLLDKALSLGIEKVERVRSSPRGRPYLEVVVQFEDNFARDRILSSGPQLSGYRDPDG